MTYEEFTALAKREISTTEYHEVVEPVYTYHPAIPNKETAAKLYDLCGLQVFRDMKPTAKRMEQLALCPRQFERNRDIESESDVERPCRNARLRRPKNRRTRLASAGGRNQRGTDAA